MDTMDGLSAGEAFLRTYHDRTPGSMADGSLAKPLSDGRTSYEFLADRVTGAQSVLDLGCADGSLLAVFARNGVAELAGIDLSEGELALARTRPELADADLRVARAQDLPFADDSFESVVSHMALMLMSDIEKVIAETARVLKPGGVFAVAVGAGQVPGSALDLFLSLARPFFAAVPRERRIPSLGDSRTRSREGLSNLLTPAGLALVSWDEIELELSGTPEEVWELASFSFYNMVTLDDEQRARLHDEFIARASSLATAGELTGGTLISVAVARLGAP